MMTTRRLQENQRYYESRINYYPFEYCTPRSKNKFIRPDVFQRKHPDIMFCCIPIQDLQTWMFETAADLKTFKTWFDKNGGIGNEYYQG